MLGFIAGAYWAAREARRSGQDPSFIYDLTFYIVLASIVGSRIFFVIEKWGEIFSRNPLKALAVWEGGLIFFGGVILALPTALYFIGKKGLNTWKVGDWIAPGFALGIAIGRIGCFFNGCCFGKPTDLPWGVVFSPESAAGARFPGTPIHPTQLYESVGELIVFFILLYLRGKEHREGFLLLTFAILGSLVRFIDDFFRYYEPGAYVLGPLTFNQLLSIAIALTAVLLMVKRR